MIDEECFIVGKNANYHFFFLQLSNWGKVDHVFMGHPLTRTNKMCEILFKVG